MIISFKLCQDYWNWNVSVPTLNLNVSGSESSLDRCWPRILRLIMLIHSETGA